MGFRSPNKEYRAGGYVPVLGVTVKRIHFVAYGSRLPAIRNAIAMEQPSRPRERQDGLLTRAVLTKRKQDRLIVGTRRLCIILANGKARFAVDLHHRSHVS